MQDTYLQKKVALPGINNALRFPHKYKKVLQMQGFLK